MAIVNGTSGNDTLTGGDSADELYGFEGNDRITGGKGNDTIVGGAGDDTLTGGMHSDVFFVAFDFGQDVITDFDDNADTVEIRNGSISDFSDIQARMTQVGPDTVLKMDNGATLTFQNWLVGSFRSKHFVMGAPVCFAGGTLIDTPEGPVSVETLRVGDLVTCADGSPRVLRWIGQSDHHFDKEPHRHKPILIPEGSLGGAGPARDLIVSPQHRIVLAGPVVQRMFATAEVLVAARWLTGLPAVRVMQGRRWVSYFSLLLDQHDVLTANGCRAESFYPGATALRMIRSDWKYRIQQLFPALIEDPATGYGPPARRILTRNEATALTFEMQRTECALAA